MKVFVVLEEEVEKITDRVGKSGMDGLLFYGEGRLKEVVSINKGDAEIMTGKMLKFYWDLFYDVKQLNSVIFNLVNQLHAVNNRNSKLFPFFKKQCFTSVMESLGKALSILYHIDIVVNQNQNLKNHWSNYKRMVKIVRSDQSKPNRN